MIMYMCKYAPIEIIEAFGNTVVLTEPHVTNFTQADTLMHPNMCSFVKAVLEDFENRNYEGMLFTGCCDSSRRLFDTLRRLHPEKFFFCFDLPRKVNAITVSLYVNQIEQLIREYTAFSGKSFDPDWLAKKCSHEFDMQIRKKELIKAGKIPKKESDLRICLAGARPGSEIKQLITDHGAEIALDLTCTGICREYRVDETNVLHSYANSLLNQLPCMRMHQTDSRKQRVLDMAGDLDGIIYHTVKFCDIYSYEYADMKAHAGLPMVKLETDATSQCAGQILTRVEAFLESLRTRRGTQTTGHTPDGYGKPTRQNQDARDMPGNAPGSRNADDSTGSGKTSANTACGTCSGNVTDTSCAFCTENVTDTSCAFCRGEDSSDVPRLSGEDVKADLAEHMGNEFPHSKKGDHPMYIMGIDSGSTSTNAVIINEKQEILSWAVIRTGAKSGESAERILQEILNRTQLQREDLNLIVSTGYGRVSIPFADKNVTEISCHGKGAHFLNPAVRTILDIGGQDSKAIRLNKHGDVIDFVMNDKCAAGTGRFLEMMARTLEISIDELGPLSLQSKENVEISSMCSVFAESEVISLIAQNKETADIAHGIHKAIAGKAISLLKRVGLEKEFMMTGGVAKNPGVVKVLEEQLDAPLYIYEQPEIVGALGAALFGLESLKPGEKSFGAL
ncbi:MAG: acyl-CoA dehydratase activase [Lachnospiraceae bacterium]|nr:acyl-CoA dehydratase activase [Lachnospiraceae bacterium]